MATKKKAVTALGVAATAASAFMLGGIAERPQTTLEAPALLAPTLAARGTLQLSTGPMDLSTCRLAQPLGLRVGNVAELEFNADCRPLSLPFSDGFEDPRPLP